MQITEEQLQQLIDPDMPQLAREIIAHEIKMSVDVKQLPPPPAPYRARSIRAQMMLLFRLQKWIGNSSYQGSLPFSVWQQHQDGFNIVSDKLTKMMNGIAPDIGSFFGEPTEADAEAALDDYLSRRY